MRPLRINDGLPGGAQPAGDQFAAGYLLCLTSLMVTHGIAMGEIVLSAEDLFPGDAVKLRNCSANLPIRFDDRGSQGVTILFADADIGNQTKKTIVAASVTLMSEFGKILSARILHGSEHGEGEAYVLLDECMDPSVEYTLIAETF